jgi:rhamnosyltransferase
MGKVGNTMTDRSVCAVIVTYHPTVDMIERLPMVLAQVQGLVVVDNGSDAEELAQLRETSQVFGFQLIENIENLGIAMALNQGVQWAISENYPWLILFDQDSRITDGFIDQMFVAWQSHPARERIASMHPRYVDPDTGHEPTFLRADDGGPVTSMTSGALMPTWIFDKIGLFLTEYFIDQVDTEYCFRIRAAGYLVADARNVVLLHATGFPERLHFLFFSFEPTHHSALRRYYISRNRIALYKKYFHIFPGKISQEIYYGSRETIKSLLAESERPRKLRNFLLGTWDGIIGRMGKREGI